MKRLCHILQSLVFISIFWIIPTSGKAQEEIYGTWEYVEGSNTGYQMVEWNGQPVIGPYTQVIKPTNPFPAKIRIAKDSLVCTNYSIGWDEINSTQIYSNIPKREDAFGPSVIKKAGFHHKMIIYPSQVDIEGHYTSHARLLYSCDDWFPNQSPANLSFFDPTTGILMSFAVSDGENDAYYFRYTKVGAKPVRVPAMQLSGSKRDISPDGKSTLTVTATLYDYTPGDKQSSAPIAGKSIKFAIQPKQGVVAGKFSSPSAVTDQNGQAIVVFTAPTADELSGVNPAIQSITIKANSSDYNLEEEIYVDFASQKGKVWVEPGNGFLPDHSLIPPDKRFPVTIHVDFEDENLRPLANEEVTCIIRSDEKPLGKLRSDDGTEGTTIKVHTDQQGSAVITYYYASAGIPAVAVMETVEFRSKHMINPLKAYISVGMKIVINQAESAYEGKGEVSAYEEIPLRIEVMDAWHPEVDLMPFMSYWGLGGKSGETSLEIKLEVKKQGVVPDYLLDALKVVPIIEDPYEELVTVQTSADKKSKNKLWVPASSLKPTGYPRIKPAYTGLNNYEIKVSLVDEKGKEIFLDEHPRQNGFLSIPTGLPADAFSIYMMTNPFGPHTEEARLARLLLGTVTFGKFGGLGAIVSLADAAYAINTGNAKALNDVFLAEIQNKVVDNGGNIAGLGGQVFKLYNKLSIAEQYLTYMSSLAANTGQSAYEKQLLSGIAAQMKSDGKQMVILWGDGNRKLLEDHSAQDRDGDDEVSIGNKKIVKISISGLDPKSKEAVRKIKKAVGATVAEIKTKPGTFYHDEKMGTISLSRNGFTLYLIPTGMKVVAQNETKIQYYP